MSPSELATVALQRAALWHRGWRPIALYSWDHPDRLRAAKAPLGNKWQIGAQKDPPETVAIDCAVAHAASTGIWAGGSRMIDVDVDHATQVAAIIALAHEHLGTGYLRRRRDNSPRTLLVYAPLTRQRARRLSPAPTDKRSRCWVLGSRRHATAATARVLSCVGQTVAHSRLIS